MLNMSRASTQETEPSAKTSLPPAGRPDALCAGRSAQPPFAGCAASPHKYVGGVARLATTSAASIQAALEVDDLIGLAEGTFVTIPPWFTYQVLTPP